MRRLRIGDKVDSDHHLLEIGGKQKGRRMKRKEGMRRKIWNEKGRIIFREKIGEMEKEEKE